MINSFFLNFNGMLSEELMTLCCEGIDEKPCMALSETGEESVKRFVALRDNVIDESKKFAAGFTGNRKYTSGCVKCANYQFKEWNNDGLIHYVNFSMYPAPCQCKCFYCTVHNGELGKFSQVIATQLYEKMFSTVDYALKTGLIASDSVYQISSGEISIHPFKDKIFEYIKGQRTIFYTNCFIFDENIADNLKNNPSSGINLSIDAGTPATWKKVKCVDNFDVVTANLVKYYKSSVQPGQITLKYIILPGVNDNVEDYQSVIEIMKLLEVNHLTLSRDTSVKYVSNDEYCRQLIGAAAYFAAMLHKAMRTFDMFTFTPSEQEEVIRQAVELLETGKVANECIINSENVAAIRVDEVNTCNDYQQYLNLLSQISKKYTVVIASYDTPVGSSSSLDLAKLIMRLGTLVPLTTDKYCCAYAAVIDCGILVFEGISYTRTVKFNTILDGEISLSVSSVGFAGKEKDQNVIELNGISYSKLGRGLNFVVYDKQNRKLIDSVSFDTYNNPVLCYREGVIETVLDK